MTTTTNDRAPRPTAGLDLADLVSSISSRAAEIESARRVPRDLLDDLVGAGCFRILLPTSHGGTGADLPTALATYERLATADGSVAWTVMLGSTAWVDMVTLPRATFDAVFADRDDVIVAGVFSPSGSIRPADGGYVVDGRWGFATGCEHATWIYANCMEGLVDGVPQLRAALFTPDEIVIDHTWTATGLCATASHHFHAQGVTVPAERTFAPLTGEHCIDEPPVHIPTPSLLGLAVASVALGIARGALEECLAAAVGKVPLFDASPLAANPLFQHELAAADTELRAARALLHETAGSVWAAALDGAPFAIEQVGRARACAAWVADRSAAVVGVAHRFGGGSAVYAESPLQRRLRDIHTLTQHFLVKPDALTTAGAVLAGQEVTVPVF